MEIRQYEHKSCYLTGVFLYGLSFIYLVFHINKMWADHHKECRKYRGSLIEHISGTCYKVTEMFLSEFLRMKFFPEHLEYTSN